MMASKGKPKRASPKVRKTAELYKSSHNIGNRTARMRVGCYKDTEFAVEYPDGFWDPVKPSDVSPERGGGAAAENHSPTRVASPPGAKPTSPQKTSKSASGATKRKLDEKPEVNGVASPTKNVTPKSNAKQAKTPSKNEKNTPKHDKTTKNDINIKPTKEVKIILEKHPTLKLHEEKKVVNNKGKVNKEKDKKETKEKKLSKEMNGEKEKKVIKDKKAKDKGKIKAESKKEIKKDNKKKKAAKSEESDVKSEHSSDYTYDSDDSEMEISFKKRKMETSTKPDAKTSLKAKVKGGKKIQPKGKDRSSINNSVGSSGAGKGKKSKSSKTQILEPRAPRIKRTACLNANAIVSALYQTEDTSSNAKSTTSANRSASPAAAASSPGPSGASTPKNSQSSRSVSPASRASKHSLPKRRKVSIDADLDEGGDEAFDLYLAEYEEMARETSTKPVPSKPSKRQSVAASPKREPASTQKEPCSPKKAATPKKESSKKEGQKKDSAKHESGRRDKKDIPRKRDSGDSNAYDFDSEDDLGPVPGLYKPQFNRDKSPKKYEIRKSPKSPERETTKKSAAHSGKKTATSSGGKKESGSAQKKDSVHPKKEPAVGKGKKKAPPKKDESSSDEFDSSSESEMEEDEKKKEEDVPLWPPPKRMASLNASAMMAASTDRNVRKSVDKSPSRVNENKKDKAKESAEEKTKEKEKEKEKKAEDFSERPDKREKSPVKKVDGVRSDGKAEAKVSPMRSNTSQASPSKHQQAQAQPDPNRRSNEHQYSPLGGRGSPPRGPGHWVQGMVSPPKPVGGSREHGVGSGMKPPVHNPYDPRAGPMVMTSPSPDVQMMSQTNYPRYPPMPTASPEVQVVEVQRTGYYQGYPPPRQQYPGYERHQALGPGYHQGLPPPAHYYATARGQQGPYPQPPGQYAQSYGGQQSPGQGSGHNGQNGGVYPGSPPQHHSSYSPSTHIQQSRTQPPPAHQHRQQPPYLDPQQQQQSSHGYGALHSMQQRYGAQPGPYPPSQQQQNKSQSAHPHLPPSMYPQQTPQLSPGQQAQQKQQQQQMSPGQAPNRGQSQQQQQQSSQGSGGGGSYQHSGSSGSAGSNGSSSGSSSSNSSSTSSSSAGGASGSTGSSGASGAGTGVQQSNNSNNNNTANSNNTNGSVADSNNPGGGSSAVNEFTNRNSPMSTNTASPYPPYPHNSIVPSQGGMQYPYAGSMSSSSSYRMMLSRGPFNTSAFTSPPGFHHSYGMPSNDLDMNNDRRLASPFDINGTGDQGYYQAAGPMMQALGEACCIQPMPYHFHQQQVKVLVHNPIIPALHPFTSPMGPSIIEIPRETKPSALISPQRLPLTGPGGGEDGNNQAQQQDAQQQHSQQGLQSPQQQPESSQQQPKPNLKELPDQKSDIKEPVIGGNGEDKKATKRCSTNNESNVVCKTESDKKSGSEPSAKSIKLGKDSSRGGNESGASETKVSVANGGNPGSSSKKSKGESNTNNEDKSGKKKKAKDGSKSKKLKDGEKSKEKKKKKKKQKVLTDGENNETGEKKKKKKKKKVEGNVTEGENVEKTKKIKKKKKKKNADAVANGTTPTAKQEHTPGTNPTSDKPKKKKKKSKDKTNITKSSGEAKLKKKKVVSSKKKLSSEANPETPGKGQDKNVAKGTKSEAKAKKAGTSTTSTKADPESVSPSLLLSSSGQPGSSKSPGAPGNPLPRATASPGSKAARATAPTPVAQASISPLAALSSPKSVSGAGNPKGMASLSVEVSEASGFKAKNTTRKTPSPGKTAVVSPVPVLPPPPKYSRKTPSPGKTGSPRSQLQSPLKVDVELAKGRKTPSPISARKTPSPSVRKTPSPGAKKTPQSPKVGGRKTPSPNLSGRKTPSPNVNTSRKTPSPNVGKKVSNPVPRVSSSPVNGRKTPSPNKSLAASSTSPKPVTSPKSANPKPPPTSPKPAASKDSKSPKAKVNKSPGATTTTGTNKDKTAAKSKKKSDKIKVLKTKTKKDIKASATGSVTKKIKKKNLKNMKKKLKVVLGLHTKSAKFGKHAAGPLKQSPSPPKAKSPVQAGAPGQSPRATALTTPKKLPSSPQSGSKPRPRIDDIARRLSIESKERREEKKLSGKESPSLIKEGGNGKKNGEGRKKEERAMKIKMVPVVCPWSWKGEPELKQITFAVDTPGVQRKCYPAICHKIDGDVINVRDCVLVRSGPKKSDVPYIAKIAALWENDGGDMMMSLLWYYRPEHTDSDRLPRHVGSEIFASKHWDQTSVACIDDKCHVLTFNEYCRFKANQKQHMEGIPLRVQLVPAQEDQPAVRRLMPSFEANPETVFLCRRVYDIKMKRILKNPT